MQGAPKRQMNAEEMLAELKRAVEASTPAPGAPPPSASTAVKSISAGREKGRSQIDSKGGRPVKSNPEISVGPRPALQKSAQFPKLETDRRRARAGRRSHCRRELCFDGQSFQCAGTRALRRRDGALRQGGCACASRRSRREASPLRRRAVVGGRIHPDPAGLGGHAGALGSDQAGRDADCTGPTLPGFDRFGASGSGAEDGGRAGSRATGQAGHWDNCDSARPRLDRFSASASVAQDGSAAAGGPATAGQAGRRDNGDSAGRRFDRFGAFSSDAEDGGRACRRANGQAGRGDNRDGAAGPPLAGFSASSSGAEAERNVGSVHLERICRAIGAEARFREEIARENAIAKASQERESLRQNRLSRRSVARSSRRTRKKRRNRPSPRQPPAVRLQSRQLRRRRSRSGSPMA